MTDTQGTSDEQIRDKVSLEEIGGMHQEEYKLHTVASAPSSVARTVVQLLLA